MWPWLCGTKCHRLRNKHVFFFFFPRVFGYWFWFEFVHICPFAGLLHDGFIVIILLFLPRLYCCAFVLVFIYLFDVRTCGGSFVWNDSDLCFLVCGNGKVDPIEECDNGTRCAKNCTCVTAWKSTVPKSVDCVVGMCCSFWNCYFFRFFLCTLLPSSQLRLLATLCWFLILVGLFWLSSYCAQLCFSFVVACGDAIWDVGEDCDNGTGCPINCRCSAGFSIKTPPQEDCEIIISMFFFFYRFLFMHYFYCVYFLCYFIEFVHITEVSQKTKKKCRNKNRRNDGMTDCFN